MTLADRIVPALTAKAAELTAAGVSTSADRSKVNAGGGWITPQTVREMYLDGSGILRCNLFLIASGSPGDLQVLTVLSGLLDKALPLVTLADGEDALDLSYSVSLPHSPTATFPAFRLIVDIEL
jgi:hypothetical protein